jgi:DNA-binding NtrC family response regulator
MADSGKILIADDEETVLGSTAALLELQGFTCHSVRSAREALEKLNTEEFDVLIADWKMPGNVELQFIRSLPQVAKNLPVILVTGYPHLATMLEQLQVSVDAHLMKPFEFDALLRLVRDAVERSRARRAGAAQNP